MTQPERDRLTPEERDEIGPPPEAVPDEFRDRPETATPKTLKEQLKIPAAVTLIGMLILYVALNSFGGGYVTQEADAINLGNIVNTMTELDTALTAKVNSLQVGVDSIPNLIAGEVSTQLNNATSGIKADTKTALDSANSAISKANSIETTANAGVTKADAADAKAVAADTKAQGAVDTNASQATLITANVDTIEALQAEIDNLTDALNDAQARITVLETESVDPTPTVPDLTVSIKSFGDIVLPASSGNQTLTALLKIELTNNSNIPVQDVVMTVVLTGSSSLPTISGATMVGGANWQRVAYGYATQAVIFQNAWGLNLNPGETKKLNATVTVNFVAGGTPYPLILFNPQIYVEDYDT